MGLLVVTEAQIFLCHIVELASWPHRVWLFDFAICPPLLTPSSRLNGMRTGWFAIRDVVCSPKAPPQSELLPDLRWRPVLIMFPFHMCAKFQSLLR